MVPHIDLDPTVAIMLPLAYPEHHRLALAHEPVNEVVTDTMPSYMFPTRRLTRRLRTWLITFLSNVMNYY